jgi:copper transport protein
VRAWASVGLAAGLLASPGVIRDASGHAVPVTTEPAANAVLVKPPREVVIRFSERVDPRASTLEVLDARGQRVDHGDARAEAADPWRYRVGLHGLADGAYTVTWRVLSADDGHVTDGAHVFAVGTASAAIGPSPVPSATTGLRPLARWLVVAGGALLLGAPAAGFWLSRAIGGPQRAASLAWVGAGAVLGGGALDLLLQARELAGGRAVIGVLGVLLTTPSGAVGLARAGLLGLLAALWCVPGRRLGVRWRRLVGAGLAVTVVVSGGLVSHSAATVEGRALALGAQGLHLVAMALWAGGLVGFALMAWGAATLPAEGPETRRLALAIPTFSQLAIPAVGVLSVSGVVLARLHLTTWGDLLGTAYGRWLSAKLVVFAAMLALGAYHQQRVHVRLREALAHRAADAGTVTRFRWSLGTEATLGLVALLLAATLGATAPPGPAVAGASPGFRRERSLEEARVRLEVTPLRPGPNRIGLTVTDPAGRPLADATAAMVQLVPVAGGVGPVTFPLTQTSPGVFGVPDAVLGIVGRWEGRLVVQRDGAYDVNDRFDLVLPDAPPAGHAHGRPLRLDQVTAWTTAVIALAAAALWAASWRTRRATRCLVADADRVDPVHPEGGSS